MQRMHFKPGSKLTTLLLGSLAALVVVTVILFPDKAFQSSLEGLTIWWKLVFPALMPFFILTELLIGFGVIQGAGVLLEPLMRILFRLPGVGGWALASGLIIGFPTGAKITASLREKGLITRVETERLTALSHLCSPLFLIMVVGVGFLHSARLGVVIAIIHYLSGFLTGILTRNKKENDIAIEPPQNKQLDLIAMRRYESASLWKRALFTMRDAYLHDGRAFGKLLGDAVSSSVQALMLIGGYMMIFSVIINVVNVTNLTEGLHFITESLPGVMNMGADVAPQWIKGLLEIHLGAYAFSSTENIPLLPQMALLGAFLGWGGLSAHAQVAGFHQKTDARYVSFLIARIMHAGLAFTLTILFWKPLELLLKDAQPSFLWLDSVAGGKSKAAFPLNGESAWILWGPMLTQLFLLLGVMLLISVLMRNLKNPKSR
ncbi:nucleoside recognition domain-containing protein [Paenibacillus sp. GCM10027628]|uniref:nucleoside recognition domain-containing protein n=1 Tax=Paenibacillus sp. GCM10027628 TaxID=3273413 RepID=UPI0036426F1E